MEGTSARTAPVLMGVDYSSAWPDEIAAAAVPSDLKDLSTLLTEGSVSAEKFSAAAAHFSTAADHFADALRYAVISAGVDALASELPHLTNPPPTPAGLTPEQHAAHLAIHELLSVEQFNQERCQPGFIQLNTYWGANGRRRFCCEAPMTAREPHWYNVGAVLEVAPPPRPWWTRALEWLADKVFG